MRAPSDVTPRRSRSPRSRAVLIAGAGTLLLLLISLRGIAGFYTDFLWFDALGYGSVWRGVLGAKLGLAGVFTLLFFAVMWANLSIADRLAPRLRPPGPREELVERYRELVGERVGTVRIAVSVLFALIAGIGTASRWESWILFTNRTSFGDTDPMFDFDIGFYVFQLPFLTFLVDWAFAATVIVLIVTAIAHYLNGGIRLQVPGAERVSPQVKAHLSVLLGAVALLKAAAYWLERYELTVSTRGFVDGGGYTDVTAKLPALNLLVIISVLAFVLFIVNIRLRGWTLPVIAVGLWGFTSIVVGAAYPAFIQKFRVEPNQSERESRYIERNIAFTRQAYRVSDEQVAVNDFNYNEDLTAADLADNAATIRNVRLWDPRVLKSTYKQQQEIRRFYRFNDVDVDRYMIDNQMTQVMIAARELDPGEVPSKTWENLHLNFTHGYGAVLSPANAVTPDGLPDYAVKDLPPQGTPTIEQPAIYFGENLGGYAIVGTERPEIDYQKEDGTTARTVYQGKGGVPLSSWFRRAAFALRFGDINPLISSFVTSESRAIYIRDVRESVRKVAPFLHYDADPYPVILKGRLLWVQDAYTTTARYPYSQRARTDRLPGGSGLRTRFNYVRNSVKVVIDAYDGDMTFYVVDETDPIARAYRRAFPDLFTNAGVSPDLAAHLRYPEDLFRVQSDVYALYHITDPADFYDRGDAWDIAKDPGSGRVATAAARSPATTSAPAATPAAPLADRESLDEAMEPYYLLMRLPQEESEKFLIMQPFTPAGKNLLSAFMVAKSDPGPDYGTLEVYVMPRDEAVKGPKQVDAMINQESTISSQISLLNQSGSRVINGNLLVVPVGESLLYVRPLYVEAEGTPVPELWRVAVVFGDRVVAGESLRDALVSLFGAAPETLEQTDGSRPPTAGDPPPQAAPGVGTEVQSLLDQAMAAYRRAQDALREGDLAGYQRAVDEMSRLVEEANRKSAPTTTTTAPASA